MLVVPLEGLPREIKPPRAGHLVPIHATRHVRRSLATRYLTGQVCPISDELATYQYVATSLLPSLAEDGHTPTDLAPGPSFFRSAPVPGAATHERADASLSAKSPVHSHIAVKGSPINALVNDKKAVCPRFLFFGFVERLRMSTCYSALSWRALFPPMFSASWQTFNQQNRMSRCGPRRS